MAGKFMKSSGLAALAAGLALVALPASAQDRGGGRWGGGAEASAQRGGGSGFREAWNRGRSAPQQSQAQAQPRSDRGSDARGSWRGQQSGQADGAARQGWSGQRSGDGSSRWSGQRVRNQAPGAVQTPPVAPAEQPRASRWERNRDYTDAQRNRSYRDGSRDRNWQDRANRDGERWQGNNNWRGNNDWRNNDNRRGYNQDARRWDRDWRRDNRYNWNNYRSSNRNVYRIGRYYAPYSNYGYRRLGIGFGLDSMFFGSRYWINDPWQYRLPAAYGPYRWVRYFDDVLLVDTYSGEVVDAIYDFFW